MLGVLAVCYLALARWKIRFKAATK